MCWPGACRTRWKPLCRLEVIGRNDLWLHWKARKYRQSPPPFCLALGHFSSNRDGAVNRSRLWAASMLGAIGTCYNTQRSHARLAGRTPAVAHRRIGQLDHRRQGGSRDQLYSAAKLSKQAGRPHGVALHRPSALRTDPDCSGTKFRSTPSHRL